METGSNVTASATNISNSLQVIFCAAFNSDQRLNNDGSIKWTRSYNWSRERLARRLRYRCFSFVFQRSLSLHDGQLVSCLGG